MIAFHCPNCPHSVGEGEKVTMTEDPGDGWAEVLNAAGEKGMVPRDYLVTVEEFSKLRAEMDANAAATVKVERAAIAAAAASSAAIEVKPRLNVTPLEKGPLRTISEAEDMDKGDVSGKDTETNDEAEGTNMVMSFEFAAEDESWQVR